MQVDSPSPWPRPSGSSRAYSAIALYLFVCFAAVLLYKGALLNAGDAPGIGYGLAAAKALVLGKVLLATHALRVYDGLGALPMVFVIVSRTLIFLVVLMAASLVEAIVGALAAGHTIGAALSLLADGAWRELAAALPLLWLIVVPCFTLLELGEALGPSTLRQMLFGGTV
ncbi:MAG: hypothetical protein AB7O45_03430 [Alphaproteobacteria bacterium]